MPGKWQGWPAFRLPGRGCCVLAGQEFCYNELEPTDNTALPAVLGEAHVLGQQGTFASALPVATRKLKQYPFKISFKETLL